MIKSEEENPSEHRKSNGVGGLMNQADISLYSAEWIGAIIRYLFFFGFRDFNHYYNDTPRNFWLNVLIGWLFKILLIVGIVILLAIYF